LSDAALDGLFAVGCIVCAGKEEWRNYTEVEDENMPVAMTPLNLNLLLKSSVKTNLLSESSTAPVMVTPRYDEGRPRDSIAISAATKPVFRLDRVSSRARAPKMFAMR
jgi:hypothetical protein